MLHSRAKKDGLELTVNKLLTGTDGLFETQVKEKGIVLPLVFINWSEIR